jgi:hypothetical protein
MIFGILTLITALCISAVAIYYSVAGLVAIFAAAAIPIMIMGGTLEIAKLVTAVWLHKYWERATWWLKSYLSIAVVVLMFITSMGIFGFLSKAHIEQTSASEESIARVASITSEIERQNAIVTRANTRIGQLENSETGADATMQAQIDKEQGRIDKAFERINPAIAQQNQIISDARASDNTRTKPYEDQLANIQAEVLRLEQSARDYEQKISTLEADTTATQPLTQSIADIEQEIIRVTNQLQSTEQGQIRAGQAIIGVTSDGLFGGNTRTALAKWVEAQRSRITQIQLEISNIRQGATTTVDEERTRLAEVVKDIRTTQIPALKDRELTMLAKIDEVRQTESPSISTARNEIQRLRESAEAQVAQSQVLIERLRSQLGDKTNAEELEADIDEQQDRIKSANTEIDTLTEEKIELEAEYRKLEAEVGPIKYIAEFVYGEQADNNMLEEAVRWVIIIIIFVFDPLAVLLLIAAQYTFDFNRKPKDDDGERLRLERAEYERARAQRIIDNPVYNIDTPAPPAEQKEEINDNGDNTGSESKVEGPNGEPAIGTEQPGGTAASGMAVAREDDDGQVDQTKGEIDGTVVEPTDSDIQDGDVEHNERDREADDEESLSGRGDVEPAEEQVPNSDKTQEQTNTGQDTGGSATTSEEELEEVIHDNGPIGPTPVTFKPRKSNLDIKAREVEYDKKDDDQTYVDAKTAWKEDNPEETLKHYKNLYIHGKIDKLPWEKDEYQQNAEQSEDSLFNKLNK